MEFGDQREVAKKAIEFSRRFYDYMDNLDLRPKIAEFYPAELQNLCEWNGHSLSTQEDIIVYLKNLPRKTKHVLECVDAQPLPGNQNADAMLVTVSGTVVYDDEHQRQFFQRFILRASNGKYYIINDYIRWLSEKLN